MDIALMILNKNGIAIRNENTKHRWQVTLNCGRGRKMKVLVPGDTLKEAMAVAENENACGVAVERECKLISTFVVR